jgi:hypothetical protein
MEPLSELVRYYNRLCALTSTTSKQLTDVELQKITSLTADDGLEDLQATILKSFDHFETAFDQVKRKVKDQISQEERSYFVESYRAHEENRGYRYEWLKAPHPSDSIEIQEANLRMHIEDILNTHLPVVDDTVEIIMARIMRHSSWKNTTMVIRPGNEPWLAKLVSNDPIYLVDENYDLLAASMEQFNEMYQRRLRTYVIREDQEDEDILWQLPDNQFGMVLAWNYFNNRPFEIIRRYLKELYDKIQPGGSLLMTFNDCDRWQGVKATETGVGLYTPGSLVRGYAELLGFKEEFTYNDNGPWTWIEFVKPGTRETLRGGQALAKILPKPVA